MFSIDVYDMITLEILYLDRTNASVEVTFQSLKITKNMILLYKFFERNNAYERYNTTAKSEQ